MESALARPDPTTRPVPDDTSTAEHLSVLPAPDPGKPPAMQAQVQVPPARRSGGLRGKIAWHLAEIIECGNAHSGGKPRVRVGRKQFEVCMFSLNLFPVQGESLLASFRRWVISLVSWTVFDKFILFLIVSNSVLLAAYRYREDNKSGLNWFVDVIADPIFTVLCTLEMVFKVIAWGFVLDSRAYLREPWNILDFVVVITAVPLLRTAFANTSGGTSGLLRMFRVLRPLRSLHAVPQMKVLVNTVLSSVPRLANVSVMGIFLFVVVGIIGITLYHGMYYNGCRVTEQPELVLGPLGVHCWSWNYTVEDTRLCGGNYMCKDSPTGVEGFCGGREDSPNEDLRPVFPGGKRGFGWCEGSEPKKIFAETELVHFDHIGGALLTVFQSMTMEGWTVFMYYAQDGYGLWVGTLYYLLLIFVTSITLLNVALAVVDEARNEFDEEQKVERLSIKDTTQKVDDADAADDDDDNDDEASEKGEKRPSSRESASDEGGLPLPVRTASTSSGMSFGKSVTKRFQQSDMVQRFMGSTSPTNDQDVWLNVAPVRWLQSVVLTEAFTNFIMFIIAANVVTMMMDKHPPQVHLKDFLATCERTFLVLFTIEMFMLLGAMGPVRYVLNPVTAFDGFIVTISWSQVYLESDGAFTALRTLRLFRVLNKLASRFPSFRVLLKAIVHTAISLVHWFVLFILFLYFFTLFAMTLFNREFHFKGDTFDEVSEMSEAADSQGEPYCNGEVGNVDCIPRAHFDTFLWALATVFQLMTGENWNQVMYGGMRSNGGKYPWAYALFFIGIMLFGQLLFLSLFLSMLMSNFKRVQDSLEKAEKDRLAALELKRGDQRHSSGSGGSTKCSKMIEVAHVRTMSKSSDVSDTSGPKRPSLSKVFPAPEDEEQEGTSASPEGTAEDPTNSMVGLVRQSVHEQQVKMDVLSRFSNFAKIRDKSKSSCGSRDSKRISRTHGSGDSAAMEGAGPGLQGEEPSTGATSTELVGQRGRPHVEAPDTSEVGSEAGRHVQVPALHTVTTEEQEENYRKVVKPWQADETDMSPQDVEGSPRLGVPGRDEPMSLSLESVSDDQALKVRAPQAQEKAGDLSEDHETTASKPARCANWPHGYACFVFHEDALVRSVCHRILTYELLGCKLFDNVILFCILTSCVCMAIDSPLRDPSDTGTKVIRLADKIFAFVFIFEMVIKLLAHGLVWGKDAYLHSGWNWLDGTVVSVSVVYFVAESSGPVKTLRILRAFRPLRVISRNENLKVVVQTIFASLPDLFTLVIVACLFLLIFALFATSLLSGRLYECSKGPDEVALSKAIGTAFVTPLCLGTEFMQAVPGQAQASCPRGHGVQASNKMASWTDESLGCPAGSAGCANAGANLTLAWSRASADTPICIGRCDPFREDGLRPPEALCPKRFTSTEEVPSICPDRNTPEYASRMQERWGSAYLASEAKGRAYVEAMKRYLVMPCAGSEVDAASGTVVDTASTVSCVKTFCPWVDTLSDQDDKRTSCRANCRTRTTIDFCFVACKEGKDFSSATCNSCLQECEAACLCEDFCEPLIKDAALCFEQGGVWKQRISQNFDNVGNSLVALFEISTTEGWVDVMYAASDATEVYVQPERDAKEVVFVLFFMFWLFFSYMFLMNLSIGVIVDQFMDLRAEGKGYSQLNYNQQKWIRARTYLFNNKLMWDMTNLQELPQLRRQAYELINKRSFDNTIMLAISVNTLAMCLNVYPPPTDWWEEFLEAVNWVFAVVFMLEAIVKIYALRWNYFKDNWNRFDFLCVVATAAGKIVRIATNMKLASFTSVIRIFRIARLFRLLRFLKGLNKIFMALMMAIPKLGYTLLILILILTLYGILGVSLFSTVKHSEDGELNVHGNFHNFLWAIITLYRGFTGEAWNEIMHDLSKGEEDFFREGSWCTPANLFVTEEVHGYEVLKDKCLIDTPNTCVSTLLGWNVFPTIYWVTYTLFVTIMVLNLMVAVILEGYEDGKPTEEGEVVALCQKMWKRYDPDQTMWLPITDALNFIKDVQLLLENPKKDVKHLSSLWMELSAYDEASDRFITAREERILETAEVALLLKDRRMDDGKFDLHSIPMKAAKALDVLQVSEFGKVHWLMAAKQVMRFESVDNRLNGYDDLADAENHLDEKVQKMMNKLNKMENNTIRVSGAIGTLVTKVVAVTKIQAFFKAPASSEGQNPA